MRTREKGLGHGLKKLAILMIVAAFAVGCGKNNTSGKDKDKGGSGYIDGYGAYGNGQQLPADWKQRVLSENRCQNGRMQMISGNPQVNASAGLYVGVTLEGDVAIIQNNVMELYFCMRADASQPNGSVTLSPIVENSTYCSVGQISKMNVALRGNNGTYMLAFYPLHMNGSSLCQGGNYAGYNNYPY